MVLIIVDIPSTYMFPLWKTIYPAKEEKTHQHLVIYHTDFPFSPILKVSMILLKRK